MKKKLTATVFALGALAAMLAGCSGEQKYAGQEGDGEVLLVKDTRNFNVYITTVEGQKFLIVDSDYATGGISVTPITEPTN